MQSLLYPHIPFDDLAVDVRCFHLFDSALDQGIIADADSKGKSFSFPVAVHIIIEVFGILISGKRIAAAARIEVIGGILWAVDVVFQKSKMTVVDDLYHSAFLCIIRDGADTLCDRGAGHQTPGAIEMKGCRWLGIAGDQEA